MSINPRLPHYTGKIHPNCDYHHGQIPPARGVECWQISRASRSPEQDDGSGCTYKHAPDLAWFAGKFYVQYLCNPKDEHTGAGFCVLASSPDGRHWEDFQVSFPVYPIPACTVTDYKGQTHTFSGETYAFNHHRMCFFLASSGRMLLSTFYGWSPQPWVTNWDNYGIGRVIRELRPDGSLGPIYFIRATWQGGWSRDQLLFPLYSESEDEGLVAACEELLSNRLYTQQWAEENGDRDELIQIKHPAKGVKNEAFCWYHLNESSIIGLWKHSRTARSDDNGQTWSPVEKSDTLVMSGQKIWGCRTSDGRFALVYDPTMETQHRYPLCLVTSEDGLAFDQMRLVHGEVPPMRYEGFWKDLGPQYMRGIAEGLPQPPDGALWITYSVNKEDIWIARIPIPVVGGESRFFREDFSQEETLEHWNRYCPKWAAIEPAGTAEGRVLRLSDREPYDYCKAERLLLPAAQKKLTFRITPHQNNRDPLYLELCNNQAQIAVRLIFREDGKLYARTLSEVPLFDYEAGQDYTFTLRADCTRFCYTLEVNGQLLRDSDGEPIEYRFMSAVNEISRFLFRTGPVRRQPTLDDCPDNLPAEPLPGGETPLPAAVFDLHFLEDSSPENTKDPV